jgi:type I restriction enzyme S subunit
MNDIVTNSYKQTDIGTIPNEWGVASVSQKYSFTKKPRELKFAGYGLIPFVPMDLVPIGKLNFLDFILKKPTEFSSGTYFEAGDLLLAKITPSFENGKQGIIPQLPSGFGVATTEVIPIKEISETSDIRFLAYYLLRDDIRSSLAGKMEGSTGRQRLSQNVVANLQIPFPPLSEQRTIAAILSKIQQAIEVQEKIIERTKELKKSLMAKLFTEGLHGEELKETEIGLMPKSWDMVKLGEVSERRSETVDPSEHKEEIYVGLEHIESGATRLHKCGYASEVRSSKNRFFKGDILYGKLRPYLDKSVLVNTHGMCSSDILVFTGVRAISQFLVYLVHTGYFLNHAIATTTGVNHPRTSWDAISRYTFGLPSKDEQEEIATILNSLDDKIEVADKKVSALKSLFKSMLHQLMTGTIRVNHIELPESLR